jgi:hypothetical protein
MFRSIKNRNYGLYFFGQMVSGLRSWLRSVAQAWLLYRQQERLAQADVSNWTDGG